MCCIVLSAWRGKGKKNVFALAIVGSNLTPYDITLIPSIEAELKVCDEAIAYYEKKILDCEAKYGK